MNEKDLDHALAESQQFVRQRQWTEAIDALDEAIRIDVTCSNAWYEKGKILNRLGRIEEALEAFEEVISINPEDTDGWYNKGVCLTKLGRTEESLQAYQEARRFNPQSSDQDGFSGIDFMGILGRNQDALETLSSKTDSDQRMVHVAEKFKYEIDLTFVWSDGVEEVLEVEEASPSRINVKSVRCPQCSLAIEAKDRIPCDYPAKELAGDLAAEMASENDTKRFYVFPNGQVPAYNIRSLNEGNSEIWHEVIVTGRFVYHLTRTVAVDDAVGKHFAECIPSMFRPIHKD